MMSAVSDTLRDMFIAELTDAEALAGMQVIPFSTRLEVTKGLAVVVEVAEPAVEMHDAYGVATELRYGVGVHMVWSVDYERKSAGTASSTQAIAEKVMRGISRTDIDDILPEGLECTLFHRVDGDETTDGTMQRRTIAYDIYVIGEETE